MWTTTIPAKSGRYWWRSNDQSKVPGVIELRGDEKLISGEIWSAPIVYPWEQPEPVNAELLAALKGVVRVADRATNEFDDARAAIERAESLPVFDPAQQERMRAALNKIARWEDGAEVDGSFDDPWSAKIARAALGETP